MNFSEIFKKYDFLGEGLKFLIENNKGNYNPYHNLNHSITVTLFSYFIGESEKLNEDDFNELLIASLFHDFNHSGGKYNDSKNIEEAKKGVESFLVKNEKYKFDIKKVQSIIEATEFPYKIKNEDLTLQQKIIRDADLCQLFESNRLQSNFLGLQKEAGITFTEQLERQKLFYQNLSFITKLGKKLGEKYKKDLKNEIEYLEKITK